MTYRRAAPTADALRAAVHAGPVERASRTTVSVAVPELEQIKRIADRLGWDNRQVVMAGIGLLESFIEEEAKETTA